MCRRSKGLETLNDLVTEAPETVLLLRVDGELRLFLSAVELASLCMSNATWVRMHGAASAIRLQD